MHDVSAKMKTGEIYVGPLWAFRPAEGWFSLAVEGAPDKIYFRDVDTATNKGVRHSAAGAVHDVDLLDRARREGWDGR